jgi:hypothetical protein
MASATSPRIEALEDRIAPAAIFINATTATYTDTNGDHVTVKFSKPLLTAGNVDNVLVTGASGLGEQLEMIDLTGVATAAQGTSIVLKFSHGGDVRANVGFINATGVDLGLVSIPGDLGRVIAGDNDSAPGIASLRVRSLGDEGLATQGGTGDLHSIITGPLGSLHVSLSVANATLDVQGIGANPALGRIGSIFIGNDLAGGAADNTAAITSSGNIGPVMILGDIVGFSGLNSGLISSGGKIASVTVGGDLVGFSGDGSGRIESVGDMGPVKIGGDVVGSSGVDSGHIGSGGKIAGVTVGGDLVGSSGNGSGQIAGRGGIGPVKIVGGVDGSSGDFSGSVQSTAGGIVRVSVGGDVSGDLGLGSGRVASMLDIGPVTIGGNISGGDGQSSGSIVAGLVAINPGADPTLNGHKLASVIIGHRDKVGNIVGGSLSGGSGFDSGLIQSGGNMGLVKILGNEGDGISGGSGESSGGIECSGRLAGASVAGNIRGDSGQDSGKIFGAFGIGSVTVTGDVRAGSGPDSGEIDTFNDAPNTHPGIGRVIIGGSLIGSVDPAASSSGLVFSDGNIGFLKIGKNVTGGAGDHSGHITVQGDLGTAIIGGTMSSGGGAFSGSIDCDGTIGALKVGTIVGSSSNHAIISAVNAVKTLTVTGSATYADVLAGYIFDPSDPLSGLTPKNQNAKIGSVFIGVDLINSNIVAGVKDGGGDGFGDANDVKIMPDNDTVLSTIGSLVVKHAITNTAGGTAHFGITAELVKTIVIGGARVALDPGAHNDLLLPVPGATDYFVNEV